MQNLSSSALLKESIQLLEEEQAIEKQLLMDQFYVTYERLKPVNLIKSTIHDITSSPYLIDHIMSTAVGLATGYVSKKLIVGTSSNIIRKLLGLLMQVGVTNTVAEHPGTIKSIGHYIYQHFLIKKRNNS